MKNRSVNANAELLCFGNTDLTETTPERPLVTLALLLYNQEDFAAESILGALSQDYEPLEIIISDDHSSDSTWKVIQSMAKAYDGPHKLLLRRNHSNLGPYSHVLEIAASSSGKLIVLAAGDDISKPNRVSTLCGAWMETGAWGIDSNYDVVDQAGCLIKENTFSPDLRSMKSEFQKYFYDSSRPVEVVHGATSAYDMRLFKFAPSSSLPILSEDGVLTFMLHALGKQVTHIPSSLIHYRRHQGAVSNIDAESCSSLNDFLVLLEKDRRYALNLRNRSFLFLEFIAQGTCIKAKANVNQIRQALIISELRSEWKRLKLTRKLRGLAIACSAQKLGYLMPAIIGPRLTACYLLAKKVILLNLNALLSMLFLSRDS